MFTPALLRKLVRDLMQRKGSLLALVLIMAIGVGCYVGMAAVWRDMDGSRSRYYTDYRLTDLSVELKRAPNWAIAACASLPNVRALRGRVKMSVLLDLPNLQEPVSGTAISMPLSRGPVLNDILLRSGGWFSGANNKEVIINDAFARANHLVPGSRLKVLLLDKQHDLLVVGTAMSPEFVYLIPASGGLAPDPGRFGVMYLPERFLQESCDLQGAYNEAIGQAHDASRPALDRTLDLLKGRLDAYGVTNTTPIQEQPSVRFLADELKGLKATSQVMPTVFLGVATLVLNVLMGRLVAQQRTVIGTLKALGYSSLDITLHYLMYGAIIGGAGALAGMGLGWWMQNATLAMYRQFFALPRIEAHFYPDVAVLGLLLSIGFAMLGTIKGVRVAAGLDPAEAMRPPPPERGGRVLPERVEFVWTRLPFRWKMILRAVFRNPFRSTVSVLASTIATALIFTALSNVESLNYLMSYTFEKVSHEDITVSVRDPKSLAAERELGALASVAATEPQLSVVCDLANGPYRKRMGVSGLPPRNRLCTPLDRLGQPIVVPEVGLVLSRKLAEILHASPGDRIRLRPLIARRQEVTTPVVGVVDSFLGLSAYANMTYLSRLLGEESCANVLMADLFPGAGGAQLFRALKQRPTIMGVGERARSLTQMNETFGKTMGTMISIMVLFAGLIAFGSVLNAALVSLSERQREVGTLRVLGYTPEQVTGIFSGESYLLNGFGVALGLLAGIGMAHLLALAYNTELYRFPVVILPSRLLASALAMLVFITLAQFAIYHLIRTLEWLDVLKIRE